MAVELLQQLAAETVVSAEVKAAALGCQVPGQRRLPLGARLDVLRVGVVELADGRGAEAKDVEFLSVVIPWKVRRSEPSLQARARASLGRAKWSRPMNS